MRENTTTIRIKQLTREKLYNLESLDSTVDELVNKLIEFYLENREVKK